MLPQMEEKKELFTENRKSSVNAIIFLSLSQPKDTAMHHPRARGAAVPPLDSEASFFSGFFLDDLYFTLTWEGRSFIRCVYRSLCQLPVMFF